MAFPQVRPNDIKTLPADMKKKLLDHSLRSTDKEKGTLAKSVFK